MYSNTIRIWYDIVIDKDNDYDYDINDDVGQNDFGTSNALDLSISSVWTRSKTVQGALGIRIRPMSSRWNLHTSLCTRNNGFKIYQNLTSFRFLPKLCTQKIHWCREDAWANCTKFHSLDLFGGGSMHDRKCDIVKLENNDFWDGATQSKWVVSMLAEPAASGKASIWEWKPLDVTKAYST